LMLQACNGDSNNITFDDLDISTGDSYSSTAITSFNIKPNSKVLAHLDSVFFTIDLLEARIFNADSLPYGTNVSKLVMNLGSETVSKITVKYTDAKTHEEKEITYGSSDSINFNEPVTLTVLSANELYERTYDVKVNVHKVKPDSLCWGSLAYSSLPAASAPISQKTVKLGDDVYCLTQSTSGYSVAMTATPADNTSWQISEMTASFVPVVESFNATDDALFILSDSGDLYTSADGKTWQSTGVSGWYSVIGGYGSKLLGVGRRNNNYHAAIYPADVQVETSPLPDGFPVSGHSQTISYTTEWSATPQAIFVGGRCADGSMSSSTWGFDGTRWVRFSDLPKNQALEGVALIPYTTFSVNTTNWTVKSYNTLIALGGRAADGSVSHKLYISRDWGLNWHISDDLMTLPEEMPALSFAQGIVADSVLGDGASAVSGWNYISTAAPNKLWWEIDEMSAIGRASAPVTSWACPYIYIFGGVAENGTLYDTVWRGIINRMTFKPLQ
ncbi:MAG: hypothetical protein K2M98_06080, partial [Muribaculum sp.]|nr:hypothetical protein [Muribaculum sp.]